MPRVDTTSANHVVAAVDWLEIEMVWYLDGARDGVEDYLLGRASTSPRSSGPPEQLARHLQSTNHFALEHLPRLYQGTSVRHFTFRELLVAVRPDTRAGAKASTANVFLRATGRACAAGDVFARVRALRKLVKQVGVRKRESVVRRLDVCVDVTGIDMKWFKTHFSASRVVGRYRGNASHKDLQSRNKLTGWSTTGDGMVFTVYDKFAEAGRDKTKFEQMKHWRWGGSAPDKALRFEFKLKTRRLRRLNAASYDHVKKSWRAILRLLLTQWIKIVKSRRRLDPLWETIVERCSSDSDKALPLPQVVSDAINERQTHAFTCQLIGVVLKVASITRKKLEHPDELVAFTTELVHTHCVQNDVRIQEKLKRASIGEEEDQRSRD